MKASTRIGAVMRRDWRLFWPMIAGVGAWQVLQRGLAEPDPTGNRDLSVLFAELADEPLQYLPVLAAALTILLIATLVIVIVHEDEVPGVRGDWLTRPVRRFETLGAKALLVGGAVLVPDFVAGLVYAFVQDAPIDAALLHAGGRTIGDLIGLVLPLFLLASMTSNLAEAAILGIIVAGANYVLGPNTLYGLGLIRGPADASWLTDLARLGLIVVIGAPLVVWQYRRPNRWLVRSVAGVGVAAWIALAYVSPYDLARMHVGVSPDPGAGASITLSEGSIEPAMLARMRPCSPKAAMCSPRFPLPKVVGMPAGDGVVLEASIIRVRDAAGRQVATYGLAPASDPFGGGVPQPGLVSSEPDRKAMAGVFDGIRSGALHMEGDMTLSLLAPDQRVTLPIDGKRRFVRGLGACRVWEASNSSVQVQCRPIGTAPNSMSVILEGARPPARCALDAAGCSVWAAPLPARLILPQRPLNAYVSLLVGRQMPKTLDIQTYVVKAHFARQAPLKAIVPTASPPAPPAGGKP
ncbi:MAG TPA: hypothetical protein VG942_02015 [Hyphomonadaceae bacterium]|nr:hypothetical protein [Hyphomonadaceae bacterium]